LRLAPAAAFALTTCQVEDVFPVGAVALADASGEGVGLEVATAVEVAREVPAEAVGVAVVPHPAANKMTATAAPRIAYRLTVRLIAGETQGT
jgi:hypothetical protein